MKPEPHEITNGPEQRGNAAPGLNITRKDRAMSEPTNTPDNMQPQHRHYVDTLPCPTRGQSSDGLWLSIEDDERLPGLFRDWQEDACTHTRPVIIRWVNAGGAFMHQRFCYDCGTALSQFIKRVDAEREGITDTAKDTLASRHRAYETERKARLDHIARQAADRAHPEKNPAYQDYLRSPEWKRKAALIIKRAGATCEGCLSRPADEVHHLTYDHIYREFAFELIALCAPCHRRCHGKAA